MVGVEVSGVVVGVGGVGLAGVVFVLGGLFVGAFVAGGSRS
jgi:hypothetical protein